MERQFAVPTEMVYTFMEEEESVDMLRELWPGDGLRIDFRFFEETI